MRIGIFGGTFDPVHIGHLVAAETVRDTLNLEQIWFLLSNRPPHKQSRTITSGEHRIQMVNRAIQGYHEFQVSTIEFEREVLSYTVDTMQVVKKRYPMDSFYFIIGADMLEDLPHWHRYEELIQLVHFVALKRPGYPDEKMAVQEINPSLKVNFVAMPQMDISSTQIRDKIAKGKSIRFLVPDQVISYIKEKALYVE